jgi:putative tryptophan/tyrosine transport system substrate-binding protein
MRRRTFVTMLGGAAAWPLAARAQQSAMPVVGFLPSGPYLMTAFRQGLKEAGFVEGQNVAIEFSSAEDQSKLPLLVADLLRRQVALIVGNTPAALAAKAATTTVPIVFTTGGDPVRLGLVASLNRPGGNATGINFFTGELVGKRVQLLREFVPSMRRMAVLINPTDPENSQSTLREVQAAVAGQEIVVLEVASGRDINTGFDRLGREKVDAVFTAPGTFFNTRRVQLAVLAARHGLPSVGPVRAYAEAGMLMSYGTDILDAFRLVGVYTARILKGSKPADLPVQQSVKVELVINVNTAWALGLDVPPTLLATADEVIE